MDDVYNGRRNLYGELMEPGHTAVTDYDGEWKRITIVQRDEAKSAGMVMMLVNPAMQDGADWLDADWLFPDPALTQWYVHPESSSVFLDEPDQGHDGHTLGLDVEEAYEHLLSSTYTISALDEALLHEQLSRGY